MSERVIELEILRYDPEQDDSPHFQTYTVPYRADWVVLDAINYVKDELDRTLSYRWSCHMAVCGSCGMMINGEPALSCHTFLRDYPEKIRIEPLQNFPVERDLVVVMDDFIDKLGSVKPYVIAKEERDVDDGEYLQSPAELAKFKQYTACINCLLCYSACPQYACNPGVWQCSFVGACSEVCPKTVDPAAAIQQTKIASTADYFLSFLKPWKRK
jgi:fumarate reductase iron-sulfur subunit